MVIRVTFEGRPNSWSKDYDPEEWEVSPRMGWLSLKRFDGGVLKGQCVEEIYFPAHRIREVRLV